MTAEFLEFYRVPSRKLKIDGELNAKFEDGREYTSPLSNGHTSITQCQDTTTSPVEVVQPSADMETLRVAGQLLDRKSRQQWLPIDHILPGQFQPRQYFDEAEIESLAQDFKANCFRGVLNVSPLLSGQYELVAGERRWRAAKKAGLKKVFCLIDHFSDEEALEFSLVENLKRANLSKLEETIGILKLIELRHGISQEQASKIIRTEGHPDKRARCDVAPSPELHNIEAVLKMFDIELQTFRTRNLRSLSLPHELKQAHLENKISWSITLELNKLKDENARQALLDEILNQETVSFRWVQQIVSTLKRQLTQANQERSVSLGKWLKTSAQKVNAIESRLNADQRKQLETHLQALDELLENLSTPGEGTQPFAPTDS